MQGGPPRGGEWSGAKGTEDDPEKESRGGDDRKRRARTGSEWKEGPWVGGEKREDTEMVGGYKPIGWRCLAPGPSPIIRLNFQMIVLH